MPNVVRDEWINIGVILEDAAGPRRQARLIEETAEFARVRRLHPAADEALLRALPAGTSTRVRGRCGRGGVSREARRHAVERPAIQPAESAAGRGFRRRIRPALPRARGAAARRRAAPACSKTRARGSASKLSDVFRRHRILAQMERSVRVEEFTQPGDPCGSITATVRTGRADTSRHFLWRRSVAGQGAGVHGGVHSGARAADGVHRGHGGRSRARKSAAPIRGAAVRGATDSGGAVG